MTAVVSSCNRAPLDTYRMLTRLFSRLFSRTPSASVPELLQRGYGLQRAGDAQGAERAYRDVLKLESHNADAHHLLGALLGERGELTAAATHLDCALELAPGNAGAHAARGNVFLMLEQRDAAAASYEQALRLDKNNAAAHFNLGLILQIAGTRERALQQFQRAYELAPDIPDLLKSLTLAYIELERYDEAQALLQAILARMPRHFEALKCIGLVLQKTHRPQDALKYYEQARAIDAGDAEFLNNFGIVLQDLGRLDAAIEKYTAAIALKPDFTLAIWHRSLAYLLQYDFARGWPDYELRTTSADLPRRSVEFPRWTGDGLAGKTLLVYAEQGLGDEIMFASCIPDVVAAGAHAVIECSPKLETLFRRSFPATRVYATTADRAPPPDAQDAPIDMQIPTGSLPLHFRRSRAEFPQHNGYLKGDPARIDAWRKRLAALGPGVKIGVSWQGGTHKSRRPVRSMALERWQPILRHSNAQFVDLQYTDCSAELAALRKDTGIQIHSWDEVRTDYEETAALVSALDLVISVCTAVIHLGGALGRPVWVMAPYSPEWRYGIAGEEMPWYPSVRVFRQAAFGEWDAVVERVAQSLAGFSPVRAPA